MIGRIDRRVVLGTLVMLVLIVAGWYFLLWKARQNEIKNKQSQLSSLQQQYQQYVVERDQLLSGTVGTQVAAQAGLLAQAIPANVDLAGILNDTYTAAALAGVPISSITPATPGSSGGATPSSSGSAQAEHLTISTTGRYFQIVDFIDQLQQLPRIYVISSVSLSGGTATQSNSPNTLFTPDLTASIAATTFFTGAPPASAPTGTSGASSGSSTTVVPGSTPTTAAPGVPTTTFPGTGTASTSSVPGVVPTTAPGVTPTSTSGAA